MDQEGNTKDKISKLFRDISFFSERISEVSFHLSKVDVDNILETDLDFLFDMSLEIDKNLREIYKNITKN
jgi:uncharacterized protein YjgD (DUF1641 family)